MQFSDCSRASTPMHKTECRIDSTRMADYSLALPTMTFVNGARPQGEWRRFQGGQVAGLHRRGKSWTSSSLLPGQGRHQWITPQCVSRIDANCVLTKYVLGQSGPITSDRMFSIHRRRRLASS